jgi:hypothetical protein
MSSFKESDWMDPCHLDVKNKEAKKIDKLTIDIVLAQKRHERNLQIFDWIFKGVCLFVIIYLIVEAAGM